MQVLCNKAQNDMLSEVIDLVERNGAAVNRDVIQFSAPVDEKAANYDTDITPAVMERLKSHYRGHDFDAYYDPKKDAELLKRYASIRLKEVYHNINALAVNGTCVSDAVRQIGNDMSKYSAILDRMEVQYGENYSAAIDTARRLGGVMGPNYTLEANKMAVAIALFITGAPDPLKIPQMTSTSIHARLDCFEAKTSTKKKLTRFYVSSEKKKLLLDMYREWIKLDRKKHKPWEYPSDGDELSVQSAIAIMNHVLSTMYDTSYSRDGNRKRVGKTR
jgi:hypothetical protein